MYSVLKLESIMTILVGMTEMASCSSVSCVTPFIIQS